MPSGAAPRLRLAPLRRPRSGCVRPSTSSARRAAVRRSSSGRSCERLPRSGSRKSSASTPMAHESSTPSGRPRLAGQDHVRRPRPSRRAATRSAPHSAYAASVPARQTTGWPAYAASTGATPSVGPATSTATPPAANRLVAKVARAVCAATGAHGGEEDRARRRARRAAPRRPRRSGAPGRRGAAARSGSASPRFGNSLTPVSGRVRWATSASRTRGHLVDPAAQRAVVEGRSDAAGLLDPAELGPAGARRGRR